MQSVNETIRKIGNKWKVYPKAGNKVLGTHDTKKQALAQLKAIEASKNKSEDVIPGGLGDKVTEKSVDPTQLKMGIEVEMEHTSDPNIAKEIAIDHLVEDPKYYTKLTAMEAKTKEGYGALMVNFNLPKWSWFQHKLIDEKDLKSMPYAPGGLSKEPHVTILYGFEDNVTTEDVRSLLVPLKHITVEFQTINIFRTKKEEGFPADVDVLKFEVESQHLRTMNQIMKTLPYHKMPSNEEYNPHMTIAYLQRNTGEKYIRNITPFELKPDYYYFSYADGRKEHFLV